MAFEFEVYTTEDGSPSLKLEQNSEKELMHSSVGAFSETQYIYGAAIDMCIRHELSPLYLSVGLGLAYSEWAVFSRNFHLSLKPTLDSYEIIAELRFWLEDFIFSKQDSPLSKVYSQVLHCYSEGFALPVESFLDYARTALLEKTWQIHGALQVPWDLPRQYSCILFDPFSGKTNPEFWQEVQIRSFLQKSCLPACVFASYAATGALKRALKAEGFRLERKKGFAHKRESTLAVRL